METQQTLASTAAPVADQAHQAPTPTSAGQLQHGTDLLNAARSNIDRLLSSDSEKSLEKMRQRSAQ